MRTIKKNGSYKLDASDSSVRVTNNAAAAVIAPTMGNNDPQTITIRDTSGGSQITVLAKRGNIYALVSNYETLVLNWDSQSQTWYI
jgi:hypothetical protein